MIREGDVFSRVCFMGPCLVLHRGKNSIRLGGPARGIVTKTVHKPLPGGGRGDGWGGGSRDGGVSRGLGILGLVVCGLQRVVWIIGVIGIVVSRGLGF